MDGGAWWATVHGVAKSWTRQRLRSHTVILYSPGPASFPTSAWELQSCWNLNSYVQAALPAQTSLVSLGLVHSRPRDTSVDKADTIPALKEPTLCSSPRCVPPTCQAGYQAEK